jgi:peptidoglycan biosynthesis protein MviN/MurJ (putative lipid II flippase)
MLAMAVVTCATMLVGVAVSGGLGAAPDSMRPKALARATGLILGGTPVYLAFNMLFVVTLAFASNGAAGDTTVLSYSYLFASYLVAGTGTALGMSRIPEMTRRARFEGSALVERTVPQGFRYAMLLVAPAMAVLITAGAPLIHVLLPGSLTKSGVDTLRAFAALLAPWTVAALLVNFLLPPLLATGRSRFLNLLALPMLAVHVAATAVGSVLFGVFGAVGAITVAPACLAVILLLAGTGRGSYALAHKLTRQTGAFAGLAAVAFGIPWAASTALPSAALAGASAAAVGGVAYLFGLRFVARREVEVLVGTLAARRGSPAG